MPEAVTLSVAVAPLLIVTPLGLEVIEAGWLMVTIAAEEFTEPLGLVTRTQ